MNEWILFTIGILIGGMIGIMGMTMISVRKQVDMIGEIMDLK